MCRRKLIYVLPSFKLTTTDHLAHKYDFLEKLAEHVDIFLIVLKGDKPRLANIKYVYLMQNQATGLMPRKIWEFICVVRYAFQLGYQTLYSHYSSLGAIWGSIVLRPLGGKTFFWHAYGGPEYYTSQEFKKFNKDNIETFFSLRLISKYVAGSKSLGSAYANAYNFSGKKVVIAPNLINLNRLKRYSPSQTATLRQELAIPIDIPIVLFVGRIVEPKGVMHLPLIAQELQKRGFDTFFIIAGDGSAKPKLEQELKIRQLWNRFLFLGNISQNDLLKYYSLATVFVFPSEREAFPNVILEALALETPIITTDVGAIRDILPSEYAPYILPVGEWGLFAQRVAELFANPLERKHLAHVGKNHVSTHFSLDSIEKNFLDIIFQ